MEGRDQDGEQGGLKGSFLPSQAFISLQPLHPWSQGSHWSEQKTDPADLNIRYCHFATFPGSPSWSF